MSTKQSKGTTNDALDASLFVGDDLHEREVELPNGTKHTFHFKELSSVEFRRFGIAENSGDDEKRAMSMSRLIAASVANPDGTLAMTEKQAAKLKPSVAGRMFNVIMEINAGGSGNESPETSGSGT